METGKKAKHRDEKGPRGNRRVGRMIQRNGHFIQRTAKNMTIKALCLKCRGAAEAINYDGRSDPSMHWVFEKPCIGNWKAIKGRFKEVISEAEKELKAIKECIALERKQGRRRIDVQGP
jgi:hypothetical protein